MAWKECSVMEQRLQFVARQQRGSPGDWIPVFHRLNRFGPRAPEFEKYPRHLRLKGHSV